MAGILHWTNINRQTIAQINSDTAQKLLSFDKKLECSGRTLYENRPYFVKIV